MLPCSGVLVGGGGSFKLYRPPAAIIDDIINNHHRPRQASSAGVQYGNLSRGRFLRLRILYCRNARMGMASDGEVGFGG